MVCIYRDNCAGASSPGRTPGSSLWHEDFQTSSGRRTYKSMDYTDYVKDARVKLDAANALLVFVVGRTIHNEDSDSSDEDSDGDDEDSHGCDENFDAEQRRRRTRR